MRFVIYFKEPPTPKTDFVNIEGEEMHEDGEYIKVYNEHQELVGVFSTEHVMAAYATEKKSC